MSWWMAVPVVATLLTGRALWLVVPDGKPKQPGRRTRPPAQAQRVEAGERWEFERIGPFVEDI